MKNRLGEPVKQASESVFIKFISLVFLPLLKDA